ncbi:MAG: hypothetical protein NT084_03210 [Bacteroidetes bacterium]|nr:hypothetical protein [Bacteroidota bacterium]
MTEAENTENANTIPLDVKPKSRAWWRRIVRLFFWISGIFIFLILVLIGITYLYQDEVKGYVISEVNKRVNTKIIIDPKDIDLTIIKTFPDVSVIFKNIAALDATTLSKRDTLLKAGSISLGFNIMDLFHQNYSIHNITVEDATLKMWVDEKGRDNYQFLKEENDSVKKDTSNVNFALNKILLKNVTCSYTDKKSKSVYKGNFRSLKFTGDFGKDKYEFETQAEFTVGKIALGKREYFKGNKGALDLVMEIDNVTNTYSIKTGKLNLSELALIVSGNVLQQKKNYQMDLAIKGDDIDLPEALSLLPASYKNDIDELESTGQFYIDGTVKGLYGDSLIPTVIAKFGINDGATLSRKNGSVKFSAISLKGNFSNVKGKDGLQINSFSASAAKSKFTGSFSMKNFEHPYYDADLSGHIDMAELQNVLQIDTIEETSGILDLQLIASGTPAKGKTLTPKDFRAFKTSGIAKFIGAKIKLKGASYAVDSINGQLSFDGNNVSAEKFSAQAGKSDILIDGTVKNLLGYLFTEREVLDISGNLSSHNLDLNSLLNSEKTVNAKQDAEDIYKLILPERLRLHLNSSISHILFRKFEAADIIGDIQLDNKRLTADPIRFHSMDGSISGSGMIDGNREDSLLITCNADIENVNIYKLFYQMENFGQDKDTTITYNNVRGLLSSKVNFASLWGNDLNVNEKKIFTDADITITNGELINFRPLSALSRFIKLDDLKDIKFKSLHNNFEIKNRIISMPKMEINSNAINITMSGTHDFDNNVDYHFIVDLDEIRAKKAKAAKPQNTEFGIEEDDGGHRTRLYISMKGYIDNAEIKYDTKGAIQGIKDDLHQEKQNLKSILSDEFGWFKKDSLNPKDKNKKEDRKKDDGGKFILQQEDSPKDKKKKDDLDDGEDY